MPGIVKNILILAGLLVIGGLGYYLFILQGDENTTLNSEGAVADAEVASAQFIRELNSIKRLDLSDEIFSDPRFQSFVDFSQPIPTLPVGRDNPFAPVE